MYPMRRLNFDPYGNGDSAPPSFPSQNLTAPNLMQVPQQIPQAPQIPQVPPNQNPMSMQDRLRMLYDQENNGPAQKAYGDFLNNAPMRSNYKPSFATSLSSALEGFAAGTRGQNGAAIGQQILDKPFQDREQDYLKRIPGMEKAAEVESKNAGQKINLLKESDAQDKEAAKEDRQKKLDESTIKLHDSEVANYKSLQEARQNQGIHFFEDETSGEMLAFNPQTKQTVSLGKTKLTPEEKANLEVKTYTAKEKAASGVIGEREKNVHESNRTFDVAHPVTTESASYVSPSQQKVAEAEAAKQLNIEGQGKYSDFINDDGTVKTPADLKGGMFSKDRTQELKDFYDLVKAKSEEIGNKARVPVGNRALSGPRVVPPVVPPARDSRIQ